MWYRYHILGVDKKFIYFYDNRDQLSTAVNNCQQLLTIDGN